MFYAVTLLSVGFLLESIGTLQVCNNHRPKCNFIPLIKWGSSRCSRTPPWGLESAGCGKDAQREPNLLAPPPPGGTRCAPGGPGHGRGSCARTGGSPPASPRTRLPAPSSRGVPPLTLSLLRAPLPDPFPTHPSRKWPRYREAGVTTPAGQWFQKASPGPTTTPPAGAATPAAPAPLRAAGVKHLRGRGAKEHSGPGVARDQGGRTDQSLKVTRCKGNFGTSLPPASPAPGRGRSRAASRRFCFPPGARGGNNSTQQDYSLSHSYHDETCHPLISSSSDSRDSWGRLITAATAGARAKVGLEVLRLEHDRETGTSGKRREKECGASPGRGQEWGWAVSSNVPCSLQPQYPVWSVFLEPSWLGAPSNWEKAGSPWVQGEEVTHPFSHPLRPQTCPTQTAR